MFARVSSKLLNINFQILRGAVSLSLIFLLIEFFDELNYGASGAALPALRADLGLTYAQVGLLLGLPHMIGTLVEPILMLLGDTRLRRRLVIGGGLAVSASLMLIAGARSFPALLLAFILSFPASGAFVSLSQATLMDLNPGREPHWMARWTVFGSLGNLIAPLAMAVGFALGLGWRWAFTALAGLALALTLAALVNRFPPRPALAETRPGDEEPPRRGMPVSEMARSLWAAARNPRLWRWTLLLQLADLMLDIFTGYAALYFTDVVGATPEQASLALTALMLAGLAADLALIPLLERVPGRKLVRLSAAAALIVFPAWLLAPWPAAKIAGLVLIRFATLGWYPVLQGEAYASAPGQSGTVMALGSLAGFLGGALTWLVGWTASRAGLPAAMLLLLAGPLSLVLFVPRVDKP